MFATVKHIALATAVSAVALASAAFAAEGPAISEIRVDASYSAATGTNAQEKFPGIEDDLRAAIAKRIETSTDAADPVISVDLRRIALDGDTMLPDSAEFNEMDAVVSISGNSGEIGAITFTLQVVATSDESAVPEGYIGVSPDPEDFYTAMVNGFADAVASEVEAINASGQAIDR
jgi:hypothetical protein